jgi:peptidase E
VTAHQPQILAVSGVLRPRPATTPNRRLLEHAVHLAAVEGRPTRLCYLPTAVGDDHRAVDAFLASDLARSTGIEPSVLTLFPQPSVPDVRVHLLAQDVLWVEGGSVVNLMAVWRAHGLPDILHACWQSGVVLAGGSAGNLCWHHGGTTDSFGDRLDAFSGTLGWLPFSNGVHDDLEDQPRRQRYRAAVATGELPAGHATEDGVGLHYVGTELAEVVSVVPGARAWRVDRDGDAPLDARLLEAGATA